MPTATLKQGVKICEVVDGINKREMYELSRKKMGSIVKGIEVDLKEFTKNGDYFKQTISNLRELIGMEEGTHLKHGVVFWPSNTDTKEQVLIKLMLEKDSVWVQANKKNLFLTGYITTERSVSFNTEPYPSDDKLMKVLSALNGTSFSERVVGLKYHPGKTDFDWVPLALVLCESARFDKVCKAVMGKLGNFSEGVTDELIVDMIKYWKHSWTECCYKKPLSPKEVDKLIPLKDYFVPTIKDLCCKSKKGNHEELLGDTSSTPSFSHRR